MQAAICTIFAKNYLAQVRVLTDSFLRYHSDCRVYGFLCDSLDGSYDTQSERFVTVPLEDVPIPSLDGMICRYDLLELSTAVKPFLLQHLFSTTHVEKLFYFDPDILFTAPVTGLLQALDTHGIVLIPHMIDPQTGNWEPSERQMLLVGVYNLGFIGLRSGSETDRFLEWWGSKLIKECCIDLARGLFVDQHWMDLAPAFFEGVHVHRDPGCNVAYWNLRERKIQRSGSGYLCNGQPLKFIHFSGFSPDQPNVVSRHIPTSAPQLTMSQIGEARGLFQEYRRMLLERDFEKASKWSFSLGAFDNGVPIPFAGRQLWREAEEAGQKWNDPMKHNGPGTFYSWLRQPVDDAQPVINRVARKVYQMRGDLQVAFPDAFGAQRSQFARWFVETGVHEHKIHEVFAADMRDSLTAQASALEMQASKVRYWLRRLQASRAGLALSRSRWRGPVKRFLQFAGVLPRSEASSSAHPAHGQPLTEASPFGVNIAGYLSAETGMGELPRALIRAFRTRNYPLALVHLDNLDGARRNDLSVFEYGLPAGMPHGVNLFVINADSWGALKRQTDQGLLASRSNIAFWSWELARFPDKWRDALQDFREIWVPSSFMQQAVAPVSPIPVVVMGEPIVLRERVPISRKEMGLPEEKCIFLFAFDMLSIPERKNPLAFVEAFRLAFEPGFQDAFLVLKTSHLDRFPDWREQLRTAVASVQGMLIEETVDRHKVTALFQLTDVYVSLHRCEGFGLTLAESMRMGKPVIATDYSANRDYLNANNGYPVQYRLVELERDYGPYEAGNVWAEPNVQHAAELMKYVLANPQDRAKKALRAAQDIEALYGLEITADRMILRLNSLQR